MKKIKQALALAMVLTVTMLLSNCQNTDFEEIIEEKNAQLNKLKTINFKGLTVNHRFKSSILELERKYTKTTLTTLFNKLNIEKNHNDHKEEIGSNFNKKNIIEIELPSPEAILEAAKVVLHLFPYEEIEGYAPLYRSNKNVVDINMIKTDFPGLTENEIKNNSDIIDKYYSNNLDYMVLNEIVENPEIYKKYYSKQNRHTKSSAEEWVFICTMSQAIANGYSYTKSVISYGLAGDQSTDSSVNHYPAPVGSSDTREDAYRHILWNALLAQHYFTISAKAPRLGFAKLVTDARETAFCGTINNTDTRAMDFHNNLIGRDLWDNGTRYLEAAGVTFGLIKSSISQIKTRAFNLVEEKSLYIVKKHKSNNSYNYLETEVENIILQTNEKTPVYFISPIAPIKFVVSIELEYYDCEGGDDFIPKQPEKGDVKIKNNILYTRAPDENADCFREVFVYKKITPRFISKDVNYNPHEL